MIIRLIRQINSRSLSEKFQGKWYCVDSIMGSDGDPIHRYLAKDGQWVKNTQYFDTKEEVEKALEKGFQPDFTMDRREIQSRLLMREMVEGFDWDDDKWDEY